MTSLITWVKCHFEIEVIGGKLETILGIHFLPHPV